MHHFAVQLTSKDIAHSMLYRDFLLGQADRGTIKCTRTTMYEGADSSRNGTPFYPNAEPLTPEIKRCLDETIPLENPQTATELTATLAGNRLTKVSADTKLYGDVRRFERKTGRGDLTTTEVLAMNKAASACIAKLFEGFELAERGDKKRARIWLQSWNDNLGGNGDVE